MKKKSILFLMLFVSCLQYLHAQDSLVFLKNVSVKSNLFTTDPTGNIYVVKSNNILTKYNNKGDSIGFFNQITRGKITQIDASNPLRVLLYFAEYNQVVILDNLLTIKSTLKLSNIGIINAPCIANSADGNIWVYDPVGNLVKINDKQVIHFTISLRNVLDHAIDPIYMIEQERNLYLVDSTEGVYTFDQFGLYKQHYAFKTKEIQFFNDYLVYFQFPNIISYNIHSTVEKKIKIPFQNDIIKVRVERDLVYVLRNEGIDIYSLKTEEEKK